MNDPQNTFWLQIGLTVIGTLAMLILTGVLWYIRQLHNDIKELNTTVEKSFERVQVEIDHTTEMVDAHEFVLFGPRGANGLVGDVKELKGRLPDRRQHPRS